MSISISTRNTEAPQYEFEGFVYSPTEVDYTSTRVYHDIVQKSSGLVKASVGGDAYHYLTQAEFENAVTNILGRA